LEEYYYDADGNIISHNYYNPNSHRQKDIAIDDPYLPPLNGSIKYIDNHDHGTEELSFKLPASKSPIMESLCVCAILGWGINIKHLKHPTVNSFPEITFEVTDFEYYYQKSRSICSKQHPTEDITSRVKSLRRWFTHFPKKKDRQFNKSFILTVKPDYATKVFEMIERNHHINVHKRSLVH